MGHSAEYVRSIRRVRAAKVLFLAYGTALLTLLTKELRRTFRKCSRKH